MHGLDDLYRTTRDVRVRTRAQMILLLAEQGLTISKVAAIVRESGETVRRWAHRYETEGIDGLSDAPRSGKPAKAGPACRLRLVELVRRRPRALGLPFSMWTAARLADRLAEATGLRMSVASIHRLLRSASLGFGRPQHTISSPDPDYAVKKGGRTRSRRAEARLALLLRRRVQHQLAPDLAADVGAEGTAGDDPNPHAADAALRAWGRQLA
ncbi:helix-turn-helix domain-containing protein [Methylobacterium sp. P31]